MKVANNTMISLFGAVRIKCTNVRHWHILYATINRIAAMVGIGIIPANGISTTSTMTSVMECTIPATGVRPPFLMLAAVLAIAPVAGIPPNKAEAILPAPWATSSMSERCFPLIIPSVASPAVFYFMYSYLQSSLPMSLVEAARIDGSGEFRTFNSIVLPIMKPAIAVQAIFTFVGSWNNYFVPALVIQSKSKMTVPILIATLRGADYMNFDMGKIYMMITVAIVPIIIVYLLLSKFIIAGVTLGGVKE